MRALVGMTAVAAALALAACNGGNKEAEANNMVTDVVVPDDEGVNANEGGNEAMNASDRGSDDRGSDDRGSDDRGSDDRGSDDRGSDDRSVANER